MRRQWRLIQTQNKNLKSDWTFIEVKSILSIWWISKPGSTEAGFLFENVEQDWKCSALIVLFFPLNKLITEMVPERVFFNVRDVFILFKKRSVHFRALNNLLIIVSTHRIKFFFLVFYWHLQDCNSFLFLLAVQIRFNVETNFRFLSDREWIPILSEAHTHYGAGKAEVVAKVWYLSCVIFNAKL
jgi:hypothetical protein